MSNGGGSRAVVADRSPSAGGCACLHIYIDGDGDGSTDRSIYGSTPVFLPGAPGRPQFHISHGV